MVQPMQTPDPGQAPGPLDAAPAYRLYHVARMLRLNLLQTFAQVDREITPEQWFVLYRLWERDGQAQSELSDRIFDDRPNITRIVNALQRADLVQRRGNDADGRQKLVYLTDEGKRLLAELAPLIRESRGDIFNGLTAAELDTLRRVIDKVESNLSALRQR